LALIAIGETIPLLPNILSSQRSQIDKPIDFKNVIRNSAVQKKSYLSFGPMVLESIYEDAVQTGDGLVKNKIQSITDASTKFVSGVKTAGKLVVGLAARTVQGVSKGVTVIKGIILKPVYFVVGSHMKILGTGLKVLGSGTELAGTVIKDAGKSLKARVGLGSTAIYWGKDNCINICKDPSTTPKPEPTYTTPKPAPIYTTPKPEPTTKPRPKPNIPVIVSNNSLSSFNKPYPTLSEPQLPNYY